MRPVVLLAVLYCTAMIWGGWYRRLKRLEASLWKGSLSFLAARFHFADPYGDEPAVWSEV